jgi:type IV pilus assembly protein PilN
MIRINLLATERRAAKAARGGAGFLAGQKMTVLGSLIVVLTLVGLAWRYWALGQQAQDMEEQITAAQREEQRLAEILRQVQEFDRRRTQLEQRVQLIDELRKGQTAPVHMIDQISRSLPDMTWLTNVTQAGYTLTIEGQCLTLTSLSDFIGNLESTRYFIRPVEIISSEVVDGDAKTPELIEFTIRGTFQMAGIDSVAPPPPGTKGKGRGGKRG